MYRRLLAYLAQARLDGKNLKPWYRVLSVIIGITYIVAGCALVIYIMLQTMQAFGLPLEGGSLEGIRLQFIAWLLTTVITIPLAFYISMVGIGTLFSAFMLLIGNITIEQAKHFTLYGKYPRQWMMTNA